MPISIFQFLTFSFHISYLLTLVLYPSLLFHIRHSETPERLLDYSPIAPPSALAEGTVHGSVQTFYTLLILLFYFFFMIFKIEVYFILKVTRIFRYEGLPPLVDSFNRKLLIKVTLKINHEKQQKLLQQLCSDS